MKNLFRYIIGGIAALLFFCNVPVYQARTPLFWMRTAEATVFPAWVPTIQSLQDLATINYSNTPYLNVLSYAPGTGKGGGILRLNPNDITSSSNGCTIFLDSGNNRFYREMSGPLNVFQCGAVGDSTTDDTAAEQAGINTIANGGVVNTIQGAPAGKLVWSGGTYKTTATLNIGALTFNNVGISMTGDGRGAAVIAGNVAGPVFQMASTTASNQITDLLITNNSNNAANRCITVSGNSTTMQNLWMNCLSGIDFEGASDAHVSNIVCDGCLGPALVINNSHTIDIEGFEAFGTPSQFSQAVQCTGGSGGSYDIELNGLKTLALGTSGVTVNSGCTLTMSAYGLNGAFGTYNDPTTHRGVVVNTGGVLNLGVGTITNWQAEGLFIAGGGTVYDTGASISANVQSATATNRYEVAGNDYQYFKSGGSIAGGSGLEIGLVNLLANGDGILSLSGVALSNSADFGVVAQGTSSPIASVSIIGCNFNAVNQLNSAGNTPIQITGSGALAANISENIIVPSHAVTAAITVSSGTANITDNLSHSGTFPATAGSIVATNNRNF